MSNFGYFSGKTFLEMELPPREWLVENIIRQGDSVILVGNEKSGKSLFIFQLICALTSGQPFLDTYNIIKPARVTYFQLEGELADSQDRMKRMIRTVEFNPELLDYYFYPPLEIQDHTYTINLAKRIKENGCPDVLIIDPIYFAFSGGLSDDNTVRQFIGQIRILKDTLKCAVILVHHTHKQKFNLDGFHIDEGDDALFGSKFLKAWADHIIMFQYDPKKLLRTMSCTTQRSGDIVKQCNLKLIEPNPLYFEPMEKIPTKEALILNILHSEQSRDGLLANDIQKRLGITPNTFHASIKDLLAQEVIIRSKTKPPIYIYNWEKFNVQNSLIDG